MVLVSLGTGMGILSHDGCRRDVGPADLHYSQSVISLNIRVKTKSSPEQ